MTGTNTPRAHILVVDDDPSIESLVEYVKREYTVSVATNGQQAIDFCRERRPDLVLLDIMMPDLDGYEVCRRLKMDTATSDIPIIFVTARDEPEHEVKGLEMGAVDFISKPVHSSIVLARIRTHVVLKQQSEQLHSMAMTDALTGVASRRSIEERLDSEWRRCQRKRVPLAVIMIDIDYFKLYNDTYGHQAGDNCLQHIASALKEGLRRAGDLLGRYGGEEFICLLPETALERAVERADELGRAVMELNIVHAGAPDYPVVTISRGVCATIPTGETEFADLLQVADAMLYDVKRGGRNSTRSCLLGEDSSNDAHHAGK